MVEMTLTTMSTRAHGTRGRKIVPANSAASDTVPIARVTRFVSPRWAAVCQIRVVKCGPSGGRPNRWGSSPERTVRLRPKLKPTMTGRDMKSVTHPSLSSPNTVSHSPAASATPAVRVTAFAGSPAPRVAMTAPDIRAAVDVGPIATCREEPKIA